MRWVPLRGHTGTHKASSRVCTLATEERSLFIRCSTELPHEHGSINAAGAIVGLYCDTSDCQASEHGFIRSARGGFTTLDVPGTGTKAISINALGAVIGDYDASGSGSQSFLRSPQGTITTLQPPPGYYTIDPKVINAAGAITGSAYGGTSFVQHGFVRSPQGTTPRSIPQGASRRFRLTSTHLGRLPASTTTRIRAAMDLCALLRGRSPPSMSLGTFTQGLSINDLGVITGSFIGSGGQTLGFLRIPIP